MHYNHIIICIRSYYCMHIIIFSHSGVQKCRQNLLYLLIKNLPNNDQVKDIEYFYCFEISPIVVLTPELQLTSHCRTGSSILWVEGEFEAECDVQVMDGFSLSGQQWEGPGEWEGLGEWEGPEEQQWEGPGLRGHGWWLLNPGTRSGR